ncbi:ABC transporter permease subunit [Novispirillum sp. DQ9]|uniref:ABC transporter permease subunit n=1 Tax=Novispirillum sp. DQ9 TaxID=3398612 RepID=UPI003C7E1508
MNAILTLAGKEMRDGLRNRWVVAATGLLALLALSLAFLGSAPTGQVGVAPLVVTVVSLASLTVFLIPLIALLLSFDAIVGEVERGTMLLLLAYPVRRWQVIWGKFLGHAALLAIATGTGYGVAGAALAVMGEAGGDAWLAFAALIGSAILLGTVFLSLGYLLSALVRERATAAGLAVAAWLIFVLLFDLALLGWLSATEGRGVSAEVFSWLLLLNPTDVFRLLNLGGFEGVREVAGMVGVARGAALSPPALLAALAAWILVPLLLTVAVFQRRSL